MAITREPIVTIFMEYPIILIRIRVARMDTGMELPTIRLALKSPKKINRTAMDIRTPAISVFPTDHREDVMISLELYSMLISIPGFFSI